MSLIHDALRDIDAARPVPPTGPTGLSHPTGLASPWHEPLPAGAPAARTRSQQAVHAAEAPAVGAPNRTPPPSAAASDFAPIRPEPTERSPGASAPWLGALASFAVVLGAGWLGWTWWQSQPAAPFSQAALAPPPSPAAPTPSPEAPSATSAAVPSAATEAATPAATPTAQGASVSGATPQASPSTAPAPAETVAAAPLPAPGSPSPATATATPLPPPAASAAPPPRRAAPVARRAVPAPAPVAEPSPPEPPIEALFAQFSVAVGAQDLAQAEHALAALRARLPAHAVGLLRAQAWFDLQRGQSSAAIEGYRALMQRLPGDEEAAINLASLLLAQQQTEPARQVLQQAAQLNPQSARLREALRRFTPQVQP